MERVSLGDRRRVERHRRQKERKEDERGLEEREGWPPPPLHFF